MSLTRQIARIKQEIEEVAHGIGVLEEKADNMTVSAPNLRGPIRILEEACRKLKAKL